MKYSYENKKRIDSIGTTTITPVRLADSKLAGVHTDSKGRKSIVAGIGPDKKFSKRRLMLLMRKMVRKAGRRGAKKIAVTLTDLQFEHLNLSKETVAEMFATAAEMASYSYTAYKEKPEKGWNVVSEIVLVGAVSTKEKEAIKRGKIIGEEVNKMRTLSNTPGGAMTPAVLARKAQDAVKKLPVKVKVLGEKEMKKLKMGAALGVAQGSNEKPRFIVMEYMKGPKSQKPIVLVGKGVTFDSGGLDIKRSGSALEMMMDMSGGAAVIHTVAIAARLKEKKNIVALIPAVENMPSGTSYRPGDILRSMSGKTIEVLNTDAEGRLILADALTYAKRYKPSVVIDVATLTGAAMVALGQECSAIFTPHDRLAEKTIEAGSSTGDLVWRMPLWEEYERYIKGSFGDVTNAHNERLRYGGAITAAAFLWQFAKEYPKWMHIDMAPRMTARPEEQLSRGSAGATVRLLHELIRTL